MRMGYETKGEHVTKKTKVVTIQSKNVTIDVFESTTGNVVIRTGKHYLEIGAGCQIKVMEAV